MSQADTNIAGYAADALASLSPAQVQFLRNLPKAELHAHLNGCIPITVLKNIADNDFPGTSGKSATVPEVVRNGIQRLQDGVELNKISDFFGLFPAIYTLTSNPKALATATRAVLSLFLDPDADPVNPQPQAAYLELRSTPRETDHMTRMQYVQTVLDEVERYPPERAALLVSVDRKMKVAVVEEIVQIAICLRNEGRRVVGIDICGDPLAGDMKQFEPYFKAAKENGLSITLHIAETPDNSSEDTLQLLSYNPDRLGHATFLDGPARQAVFSSNAAVEICLSSNLLCKTVQNLDEHHIRHYLECSHPVAICTDDTLPFRNSLLGEYALLLAAPPLGLGLVEAEVERIARMSMKSRFPILASSR
ncbi:Metallo-dependent hydrolase [Irpex rosettiformis]|uniref:Metallo-dependent hydrolase n=1 Tax=Irpex rosettiformis TaxID=378272 RepID=A0ACB8TUU7_9APHY|nr:Metallo-dependent hydrolase [Irpex rosettiformis]